jgi:competence protein ComEC
MPTLHFVNVSPGDCTIIEHASGRVTMIDVCDGNVDHAEKRREHLAQEVLAALDARTPDLDMTDYPSNPIDYAIGLGITSVFRFILTHPDMDHMDGLAAVQKRLGIGNFWHSGIERAKPDFGSGGPYDEADWDCYARLRAGLTLGTKSLLKRAGARFPFANKGEDGTQGGDGLYILAPDAALVQAASEGDDFNDGSYVILYRSAGGRIIIPGDAHDGTWEYVLEHHLADVADCSVLIAPHHGRKSERSYDFLDELRPRLTLFGSAPEEHQAYAAWDARNRPLITSNECGNIVLAIQSGNIDVFVENETFATQNGGSAATRNDQGYSLFTSVPIRGS